jgi:ComF family protein
MEQTFLNQFKDGLVIKFRIFSFLSNIYNILIPPVCYSCNQRIDKQSQIICPECEKLLIRQSKFITCNLDPSKIYFKKVISIFYYNEMMQALIHNFKFLNYKNIGNYLTLKMIDIVNKEYSYLLSFDATVCVPMHFADIKERFHHSYFISEIFCKKTGMNDLSKKIIKITRTKQQSRKKFDDRINEEVQNPFKIKEKEVFLGKKILLIDDVFTSGLTASRVCETLLDAGVKEVHVLTIASGNR